ncbi:MAG TPA: phosphoribosylanthranilate isomerase [Stellaceae bacterium]|nr:phosphoribosylanthranilate isomerase [Stellaceae bacterium]
MKVAAKICGINAPAALAAAVAGGAQLVGFVFYPPSPRHLTLAAAAALATTVPAGITRVGVLVDPEDALLAAVLDKVPLDLLQLHGHESPERVAAIKSGFGKPVMKAVPIAGAADLDVARRYFGIADRLLFDAKPPADATALPGGNGLALDWQLLRSRRWPLPWILSGGLTTETIGEAVATSGARVVDVSSGVESAAGVKDPAKIRAFLARVGQL